MSDTSKPSPCPSCGAPASGRFCSSCGGPLGAVACGACHAELTPGAKFCHRCGTPVGTPGSAPVEPEPQPGRTSDALPWAVAAIALLALVAMVAGQRFARSGQSAAPDASIQADTSQPSMGPAPDISQMSPDERASRLFDLIMGAYERGQKDTVQMFAPMGTAAFQMLDSLSLDQRYDMGRIAEVSGNDALAAVEADSILKKNPNHLLGLILAAQAANSRKDSAAERRYLDRLLKAEPGEMAKQRPEYSLHENDIKAALELARKR
ncbi:MAG TPA: zinc ribbon domain-containing protein [Gemmatimonadaceae bacterium]|nr:zinc ribbon domain-containing protein [Gemmatimonadaceae bacterium]